MDEFVESLVEKELILKDIYLCLVKKGINAMSEDIEMLNAVKNINENLAERHKIYVAKSKFTSRLALGNNSMLPRVKNNPCFSSYL